MRGIRYALLSLTAVASSWAAAPVARTGAASMDPYAPIRNSAIQFDAGVTYMSQPSYFAAKADTADYMSSGSDAIDLANAGSLTEMKLKIRYGLLTGAEILLELPYYLASGDVQRIEPSTQSVSSSADTVSGGFGDWTFGAKVFYDKWGVGGYLAFVVPVGGLFGSEAYVNGDGQINMGLMYDKTFSDIYRLQTNFVFGYDLPAVNTLLDKQNSYSFYMRHGAILPKGDDRYQPYLAYTLEGFGDYISTNKKDTTEASSSMRHILTPGVDARLFGDVAASLSFPVVLTGSGNHKIGTYGGWGVNFTLKYMWFRL